MEFTREPLRFYNNNADGTLAAEITWETAANGAIIVIEHTFVNPELRGQGIAAQLVQKVVDLARSENKQILPLCPYAKKSFINTPEYADLWYKRTND